MVVSKILIVSKVIQDNIPVIIKISIHKIVWDDTPKEIPTFQGKIIITQIIPTDKLIQVKIVNIVVITVTAILQGNLYRMALGNQDAQIDQHPWRFITSKQSKGIK